VHARGKHGEVRPPLDSSQAVLVLKMNATILIAKLTEERISGEEFDKMSREQLMAKRVEILILLV